MAGRSPESSRPFLDRSGRLCDNRRPTDVRRSTHPSSRSSQDLRQPPRAGRARPRGPCGRSRRDARCQWRRQDDAAEDPRHAGASHARHGRRRGPRLRPGPRGRAPTYRPGRPRRVRLRGPDRARELEVLDHARRALADGLSARRSARQRRARARCGRAGAHLLGGHEAPALARAIRAGSAQGAPARRALLRPRPAREEVARGAPGVLQGGRRGDPDGHPQLRPRARGRRPARHPRRRGHCARYAPGLPVAGRRAAALRRAHRGRAVTFLHRAFIVVWKDLLVERRSKETFNALFFFALQFAVGPDRERLAGTLPGLLWLGFILTGLLGLGRTFVVERENDCWEALRLAPGDKSAIYVGKLAGNLLLMFVVEAILVVLFGIFFNLDLAGVLPALVVVIGLGTVAFAAVGTLFAAMTSQVRARELLFPVLLLPVQAPVLLATVKATEAVLLGEPLGSVAHWLKLLGAADVIFVAVGVLTFDFVLEG